MDPAAPASPPPSPPGTEPSPQTRHRLQVQMNDPKVTVPDALDLAMHKIAQAEEYFVQHRGLDTVEMQQAVSRLREAAFWWNEFNGLLRRIAEQQAKPEILVTNQMPPENAGARGIQLEQ